MNISLDRKCGLITADVVIILKCILRYRHTSHLREY